MKLDSSTMVMIRNILVYGILAIIVIFVTKQYNIWGTKRGASKTKVDVRKDKDDTVKRNILLKCLNFCKAVCDNFGFISNQSKIELYQFYIDRGNIYLRLLDRNLTSKELLGIFKILKVVFCFLGAFLTILTGIRLFILFFIILAIDPVFKMVMEGVIMDEDKEIEEDFPDLYLLLYTRLARGTSNRIAPTLDEYLKSIDTIYGEDSHKAIRKFVLTLRKYIEIYGDDSMAVHKMRDTYKSAMVVNFFNLAVQALRGVDNREKLLAFKMELSQKKLEAMTKKANQMVEKGQRAIMLIYIILAEFVILSWIAKIGPSILGNLF